MNITCPDCGGKKYKYANYCAKCSAKGERNSRYGVKLSDETKRKIGNANRGSRGPYGMRSDSFEAGRGFARRWFPLPELCDKCKTTKPKDRHHKDGNPLNNDSNNISFLCRRCHQEEDGRMAFLKSSGPRRGEKLG